MAIAVEAKNFRFADKHVDDIRDFITAVLRRQAKGVVVAQSFEESAREQLEESGIIALDIDDMIDIVALWDPAKQKIAVNSMRYYAAHVEQKSVLINRLTAFLDEEPGDEG